MKLHIALVQLAAASAFALGSAHASDDPVAKVDNGLGELPPYGEWKSHPELARFAGREGHANVVGSRVAGEKLDSGLGALPHYREWKHHPALSRLVFDPAGEAQRNSVALRSHQ